MQIRTARRRQSVTRESKYFICMMLSPYLAWSNIPSHSSPGQTLKKASGVTGFQRTLWKEQMVKKSFSAFVTAQLSADTVRDMLKQAGLILEYQEVSTAGLVRYHNLIGEGPESYSQPRVQYIFETEIVRDTTLKMLHKDYQLKSDKETIANLRSGNFETHAQMPLLDHFIRHRYINIDNEPNLAQIQSRLYRNVELPEASRWKEMYYGRFVRQYI